LRIAGPIVAETRIQGPGNQGASEDSPLARHAKLMKVGRLDPPPGMFRGDKSTRG
jgi:hypothetical protein